MGTLSVTSFSNIYSYIYGFTSVYIGDLFNGFTKKLTKIPYINAPKPNPETIKPLTNPFLPGKWLHEALKGAGYIKPFPIPKRNA